MLRNKKLLWVALLYLSQGFPFGVITFQLGIYLRSKGSPLTDIGIMSLLTLPWSLKILWAPFVDRFGEKKYWIAAMQVTMASLFFLLPSVSVEEGSSLFLFLVFLLAMASATADIAIDGYTIQTLTEKEMPSGNAIRLIGWKVAYILSTGAVGALVTWWSWSTAFVGSGFFLIALSPWTLLAPKPEYRVAEEQTTLSPLHPKFWLNGYSALLSRPGILQVLLFVLTYKLGSSVIATMIRPFWVDKGYSTAEIGLVSGTLGTLESFIAPLVGAWLISRVRLFNALWIFGILQTLPTLIYGAVAHWDLGRVFMYTASLTESFDISLGQVAFMGFLMLVCEKKYAATQYAFLSAIFGFTRSVAGWIGSLGAQDWGYAKFFFFAFFLGFVSFPFLPWVRKWIDHESHS